MDFEREPFITFKDESFKSNSSKFPSNTLTSWFGITWKRAILLHSALILFYTFLTVMIVRSYKFAVLPPAVAIDNLAFKYVPTVSHNLTGNPFAGSPTPEIDAAWDSLMAPMHIRITMEELKRTNQESVALDSGGYLGWMGAFHELHCIQMLRQWNYKEYYHPNISVIDQEHLKGHIDHCFEMLRQSAMCHADASITTFKWDPSNVKPMFNISEAIHTCVDWDTLMQSLAGRIIQKEEIMQLQNPLMSKDYVSEFFDMWPYKEYTYSVVNEEEGEKVTCLSLVMRKFKSTLLIICLCLLTTSLGFVVGSGMKVSLRKTNELATFEVQWEPHTFSYNSSFSEAPSSQTDRAWREMLPKNNGFFFHPTIAPTISVFSVFHQLYCVNHIRGAYWANHDAAVRGIKLIDDELPMDIQSNHVKHCIDLLRQSLMCHADITIEVADEKIGGVHGFRTEHQCGNWEKIVDWLTEQQIKKPV